MHFDLNSFLSIAVSANLLLSLARHFFTSPRQQAQIDSIENKVDGVLNTVQAILPPPSAKGANN